jgi:hypothetical protein
MYIPTLRASACREELPDPLARREVAGEPADAIGVEVLIAAGPGVTRAVDGHQDHVGVAADEAALAGHVAVSVGVGQARELGRGVAAVAQRPAWRPGGADQRGLDGGVGALLDGEAAALAAGVGPARVGAAVDLEHGYRPRGGALVGQRELVGAADRRARGDAVGELAAEAVRHAGAVREAGEVDALRVDAGDPLDLVEQRARVGDVVDALLAGVGALQARRVAALVPRAKAEVVGDAVGVYDDEALALGERGEAAGVALVAVAAGEGVHALLGPAAAVQRDHQRVRAGRVVVGWEMDEEVAVAPPGHQADRVVAGRGGLQHAVDAGLLTVARGGADEREPETDLRQCSQGHAREVSGASTVARGLRGTRSRGRIRSAGRGRPEQRRGRDQFDHSVHTSK